MEKTDRVNVKITNADGVLVGTMRRQWLPGGGVALSIDIDARPTLVKYCKTAAEIRAFIIEIWADFKGLIPRERKTAQQAVLNLANLYGGEISNQKGTGILDLARRAEYILRQLEGSEQTRGWEHVRQTFLSDVREGLDSIGAETIR